MRIGRRCFVDELIARLRDALDKAANDDAGARSTGATLLVCAGEALGALVAIQEENQR